MINNLNEARGITDEERVMLRRFRDWTRDVVRDASVGDWIDVTFENSWSNFSAAFNQAQFRSLGDKRVEIRGLINSGTIGLAAFTLPVSFRPVAEYVLPSVSFGGFGQTNVESTGAVVPTTGSAAAFSMDGIVISLD